MRRVAFLWLPHWPTDRLTRNRPDDAAPLVVCRSEARILVIAAACPRAARLGLRAGMRLAHAQAMHPGLRVQHETPASAQADQVALDGLAAWCLRYTPLTRALPPDGIWLDLTGCTHLGGGEQALLFDLQARLSKAGLSLRIGLADTPGAAHALARHAASALSIAVTGDRQVLDALPVEALRLDAASATLLHRFGLRRIGDLAALPRAPLTRRLGEAVTLRLDQALGRVQEPIMPCLPEPLLSEAIGFAEPLSTAEALSACLSILATGLCRQLQARGQGARRLQLCFERIDNSQQFQHVALARASHDARHFARLFEERLEQVDPGEGVERMRLSAILAEPLRPTQDRLGLACLEQAPAFEALALLIDRLGNRLGADRLWRPGPMQSDVPERSVRRLPPLQPVQGWSVAWPAALPRPIRLFDPPLPVRTLTTLPDHPPSFFIWRNHRHQVRRADGPERIAGEWWRRSGEFSAIRDYFRLEDETGRRFWLFRRGNGEDLGTGDLRWFLHGLF